MSNYSSLSSNTSVVSQLKLSVHTVHRAEDDKSTMLNVPTDRGR
jgi:hypothetical protein